MDALCLTIEKAPPSNAPPPDGAIWQAPENESVYVDIRMQVHQFESDTRKLCIAGHPFIGERIEPDAFAQDYFSNAGKREFLREINGEFLLVDFGKTTGELRIVNSRFASPIFWYVYEDNWFLGSTSYTHLSHRLCQLGRYEINPLAFAEFFYFKRLFGEKTCDTRSRYLKPAHEIVLDKHGFTVKPYWQLRYTPNRETLKNNARKLSDSIRQSIRRKSSDEQRYGLFLSGGLDTRTVLAHFEKPPHCFTLTHQENRELAVARQLAQWKAAPHTWIQIQNGHYQNHLAESVLLRGSMYLPDALFLGHRERLKKDIDVLFAGYGFDYFFQGMYLPARMRTLFGKPTLFKTLDQLPEDLVLYFWDNISYRTKGPSFLDLIKPDKRDALLQAMRQEIASLIAEAREISENPYEIWEFLSLGHISRHYTYGGQLNLMTQSEYRTLAYDNDLYDLYLSIPAHQRFDARVFRHALHMADPRFHHFISANHGYPAGYSSNQRAWCNLWERFKRKARLSRQSSFDIKRERTWLPPDQLLRTEFSNQIQELKSDEFLDTIPFLDRDTLKHNITQWENEQLNGDQLFLTLLSSRIFLKNLYGSSR